MSTIGDLESILAKTIPAGLPTLTVGSPGVGKSDAHRQVAERLGVAIHIIYPALLDPTDIGGLPVPRGTGKASKVCRLLDDTMMAIVNEKRPALLLIDELGQASPAMQAAMAPIILDRRIGPRRLPDCVTVACCTNRRGDRAGASVILSHLISRMATVISVEPDLDSWLVWATGPGRQRPEVVSHLRARPARLQDFDAEAASRDLKAYPCPRSWAHASSILNLRLDPASERIALCGCIGEGDAVELCAHLRLCRAMVDIDEVLANPSAKHIPKSIGGRLALVSGIACRGTVATAGSVISMYKLLVLEGCAEYGVLMLRDLMRSCPDITSAPSWSAAMSGDVGKAICEI